MFIENAKLGRNHFWRYLLSFFIILMSWQSEGAIPLLIVLLLTAPEEVLLGGNFLDFESIGIDQNLGLALLLFSFLVGLIGLFISIRYIHHKPLKIVLTGRKKLDIRRIIFGGMVWGGLLVIIFLGEYFIHPGKFQFQFDPADFIPLFIIAIVLIPIQTSFEEILFRGYYMQAISLLSRSRWVPLLITSVIFALLHGFNPEVKEFGFLVAMPQYLLFGLLFGVVTLMDEGLEIALGVHAANNIFACLVLTNDSSVLQTAALFKITDIDANIDLLLFVLMIPVFLLIVSKVYKWNDWGKLFRQYKHN